MTPRRPSWSEAKARRMHQKMARGLLSCGLCGDANKVPLDRCGEFFTITLKAVGIES